jgi:gluconolactonase
MSAQPRILAEGLGFPEGPVVLDDGSVAFVEIAHGRISRCRPDGRVDVIATPGGGPNGAALGPDGALYVCNNGGLEWHRDADGGLYPHGRPASYSGGRIERIDLATGRVERLYDRCGETPLSGPNDLVFDGHGGFWFTDLGELGTTHVQRGRVFHARADGSAIRQVVFPMLTPNGIGLSPDGRTLYVAETVTARLWAFDVAAPGQLALQVWPHNTPGRLLFALPHYGLFDSLAVEEGGNIAIATCAMPGLAGITVVAPTGGLVEQVPMPDRSTTNIAFGGADRRTAFVTLSRTGRLAAVPWARPGLATFD